MNLIITSDVKHFLHAIMLATFMPLTCIITCCDHAIAILCVSQLILALSCDPRLIMWSMLTHRASNRQEYNGRNLSFWEAMAPGVPLVLLGACYYLWSVISPNDIIIAQPRVFLFSMGIVFSNIAVSLTSTIVCVH